jgi:hypothetical protein
MGPNIPRGTVDWSEAKSALEAIHKLNPVFTDENMLIGGAAAWFYRRFLEEEKDTDFSCPTYTADEEQLWLSRDLDFIGTKRDELAMELETPLQGDPPRVIVCGVWVDTPNEGLFLTKERAARTALEIRNPNSGSTYKVASPILLFREKHELIRHKEPGSRPQDHLHIRVLEEASKLLLCKLAEQTEIADSQQKLLYKLIKESQESAPQILTDLRLQRRLDRRLDSFASTTIGRKIAHLLRNQVLRGLKSG